jgi:hypothetical protein
VAERRLRGDIEVDERTEVAAEGAEKTLEGGFDIGVSRSEEYSKPGRFPKERESEGKEVEEFVNMLLMFAGMMGGGLILSEGGKRT